MMLRKKNHRKNNIRKTVGFISSLLICVCMSGCSMGEDVSSSLKETESTTATTAQSESTTADKGELITQTSAEINPMTGESGYNENAVGKRPVAIMVSNIKDALPQYGISSADVIYELPVEGGITRMMAVYADYTNVDDVCSVRSCRYYYPQLAFGMDAIYCHWGQDQVIAKEVLNDLGIDHIDGGGAANGTLFLRDEKRAQTYATEHTGYLKGSALSDTIESFGYRTDLNDADFKLFNFADPSDEVVPSSGSCTKATCFFSGSYYSGFNYDTASGTYKKLHSDEPQIDGKSGEQLAFRNVFMLRTDIEASGIGALLNIALNSGTGYYISNGSYQEIMWSKASDSDPIKITDMVGNEITINAGKSYIGILSQSAQIDIAN